MSKREEKVEEPPKICPLLSMANPRDVEFNVCIGDRCAFHLSKLPKKMEKCIWVRIALSLGMIAERRGTSMLEQSLKRRMRRLGKKP